MSCSSRVQYTSLDKRCSRCLDGTRTYCLEEREYLYNQNKYPKWIVKTTKELREEYYEQSYSPCIKDFSKQLFYFACYPEEWPEIRKIRFEWRVHLVSSKHIPIGVIDQISTIKEYPQRQQLKQETKLSLLPGLAENSASSVLHLHRPGPRPIPNVCVCKNIESPCVGSN